MRELGFGCGSVLGRVGRGASLRAMAAAWDEGITHFDTARSYGFGEAEGLLGEFLEGKRDRAVVATKYGIAPQRLSAMKRVAVPVVRVARGLGVKLRPGGSGARQHGEFSVSGLRAALETSLRELRTDWVDVLYLHEATTAVFDEDELMAELAALVQAGKVRRVGLYGAAGVCREGSQRGPAVLGAMQFGADVFAAAMENGRGAMLVGNHPFGSAARVARVGEVLHDMAADEAVAVELREKLRGLEWQGLVEALFGMVLREVDVVVLSMMAVEHVRANVEAVRECRFTAGELGWMRERMLR